MPKWFVPVAVVCGLMFAAAPLLIANAPYESTMGLVQKIFYVHLPSALIFLISAIVCGVASVRFLFGGNPRHDRLAWAAAELVVLFGIITLVTGPLWARKAWGVWWQWDVRLTASLMGWMVGVAYLLLRKYGGPGSDKLAAGLALFGMANVPFIYISVNYWRTIHPDDQRPADAPGVDGPAGVVYVRHVLPALSPPAPDARPARRTAGAARRAVSVRGCITQ